MTLISTKGVKRLIKVTFLYVNSGREKSLSEYGVTIALCCLGWEPR
ncbi:hypothetical protein NB708_003058 [Pantoea ananatis]|nr:hypothetical protein [Pantoea ananatis]MCW0340858.1 hypothetical protein [Pantoea ananatis]MCW0359050.1 hypothetical protein [Pantoea ananatis]